MEEDDSSIGGRARVSLRQAFGLGANPATPTQERLLAEAIYRGASAAILGRIPAEDEIEAAVPPLERALQEQSAESGVEGMLAALIDSPHSRWVQRSASGTETSQDVFAAVVRAAFRSLLRREGGDHAVDIWRGHFGGYFEKAPLEDFIVKFIETTMASEEWRLVQDGPRIAALRGRMLPPPNKVGISTHISLGADGFTSGMFKRFGLKRWSGPFDWCSTSPAIIRAILSDDFRRFLAPEEWRSIPLEDRPDGRFWQSHHPGYEQEFGHACILHSHDMTQEWGQVSMLRCVERFRASLRSLASKLVLQVVREGSDPGGDFLRTVETLEGRGRNIHFVMVSLLPERTEGPFPEIEPALARGAHRLLRMRMLAPLQGIEASDMMDEVVLLRAALTAPILGQELQQP